MSTPMRPLPDVDPLKAAEVAAAFGVTRQALGNHLRAGRFPGAFRTLGTGPGPGGWRIPHDDVVEVGRQLGLWP